MQVIKWVWALVELLCGGCCGGVVLGGVAICMYDPLEEVQDLEFLGSLNPVNLACAYLAGLPPTETRSTKCR